MYFVMVSSHQTDLSTLWRRSSWWFPLRLGGNCWVLFAPPP